MAVLFIAVLDVGPAVGALFVSIAVEQILEALLVEYVLAVQLHDVVVGVEFLNADSTFVEILLRPLSVSTAMITHESCNLVCVGETAIIRDGDSHLPDHGLHVGLVGDGSAHVGANHSAEHPDCVANDLHLSGLALHAEDCKNKSVDGEDENVEVHHEDQQAPDQAAHDVVEGAVAVRVQVVLLGPPDCLRQIPSPWHEVPAEVVGEDSQVAEHEDETDAHEDEAPGLIEAAPPADWLVLHDQDQNEAVEVFLVHLTEVVIVREF